MRFLPRSFVGFGGGLFNALHLLTAASIALAADLSGTVARVSDGDTLTIQTPSQRVTVRLEGIDAPELAQPYGLASKDALSALCALGSPATVEITGRDRYGRTLGWVTCAGTPANRTQITGGWAWAFTRYLPPDSPLIELQGAAKAARIGLWADPEPEAPWAFRARRR